MKRKSIFLIYVFQILLISSLSSNNLYAQSGITYSEFIRRINDFFNPEMIEDIHSSFSNTEKITIWSWDVGDFSEDGHSDLAITYKIGGDRQQIVYLRMFADVDGYFVKVGEFSFKFIDLPLEIGTNIKDGTCYVSQKIKADNWKILGYKLMNGALLFKEEYASQKIEDFTVDTKVDYYNLWKSVKILNNKNNILHNSKYFNIPSYSRGRLLFHGFNNIVRLQEVDFVNKGAYFWNGPTDCSAEVSSAYDDDFLYFQINVIDDFIVQKKCDTCTGECINIWFDLSNVAKVKFWNIEKSKLFISDSMSNALFNFKVFPGDFLDFPPQVQSFSNDYLTSLQQISTNQIKASANLTDYGYIVKVKIPFSLLSIDITDMNQEPYEMACTIEVQDIDNEFRPEEATIIATSQFNYSNSSTFGTLTFVPNNSWYGECNNIYRQDIYQTLLEFGF